MNGVQKNKNDLIILLNPSVEHNSELQFTKWEFLPKGASFSSDQLQEVT